MIAGFKVEILDNSEKKNLLGMIFISTDFFWSE
jgi:hypothetical protein